MAEEQRKELDRLIERKASVDIRIREHLAYVADRIELHGDAVARQEACMHAVSDGYLQGVAENVGRVQNYR